MESGSGSGGAMLYLVNGSPAEFYCIDLDCKLPDKVCPITRFDDEITPGWTVVDKCIYCIGGYSNEDSRTVGKTLHKYNTSWERIVSNRIRPLGKPFVFAFQRKIYVVGGYQIRPNDDEVIDWKCPGEYYHLDTGTWHLMPKLDVDICIQKVSDFQVVRVMDDKTTLLFYLSYDGSYLFYNLVEDAWEHNRRINNAQWVMDGLMECYCIEVLFTIANVTKPVVCDSTLYWFNNDLCLYGFDYIQKRWFRSNTLYPQLLWESLSTNPSSLVNMALLFYINNQTFVAVSGADGVLDLAIINVERDKDSGSISISLKYSKSIKVETSHNFIVFIDGMTIGKDEGSTTTNNNMLSISGKDEGSILGKREHASVD